jgi:hypothetical protein
MPSITRDTLSSPALRIPVSRDGHPLRNNGSPSSTGGFTDVEGAADPGTIPYPSPETHPGQNLDGDFEACAPHVEVEDASDEANTEADHGSDLDTELGGDDDTASNYGSEDLKRPLN